MNESTFNPNNPNITIGDLNKGLETLIRNEGGDPATYNYGIHYAPKREYREIEADYHVDHAIYAANFVLGTAEWALDVAGYIPGVSSYSALVRFGLGLTQIAAGAIFKITSATRIFFVNTFVANPDDRESWHHLFATKIDKAGNDALLHGVSNCIRSFFESIQWLNLICLGYDLLADKEQRILHENPEDVRLMFNWLNLKDSNESSEIDTQFGRDYVPMEQLPESVDL